MNRILLLACWLLATPLAYAQVSLPVTFEEDIDYGLADFGNAASMLVEDPEDATNTVVETFRPAGEACFAGTTVGETIGFAEPLPFSPDATTMSVRVWSPEAGVLVRFKVEKVDDPTVSVETQVTTSVAGAWDTLVFDLADEVTGTAEINFNSEYTKASIFFDFWCPDLPAPTENATYYWDDVTFGGEAMNEGISLPVTFEDDIDYELTDFGNAASMLVEDPEDATNTVVETFRPMGETCFAGTTVGEVTGFASPIPFAPGATTMTIRVWSPEVGIPVRFKVEKVGEPTVSVETQVTTSVAGAWDTLVFDFDNEVMGTTALDFDAEYTKGSIFFDFWCGGDPRPGMVDATYYWDDVTFGGAMTGDMTIAEARAAGDGAEVTVTGIVTRAKGDFAYFQDATAGLTIRQTEGMFFDQVADGTIAPGVTLTVSGTLSSFRGLQQLSEGGLASYTLGETVGVPAPVAVTVQELNDNGEQYEAELVTVMSLTTMDTGTFDSGTNYDVTDGTSTGTLRVPNADDSDVDGSPIPDGSFNFTGVAGQFTFDEPAVNGYQLLAINDGDVAVGGGAGITLPITFEEDIDYGLADFGNAASMLVEDPEDATNTVVETFRPAGEACFAGTTVGETIGFAEPLPFSPDATTMSVRVWSPEAGVLVRFKVEKVDDPTVSVETQVTTSVAGAWDTLVFDLADEVTGTAEINFNSEYTKASIFFDFWCPDLPAPTENATYYWDDVTFGGETMGDMTIAEARALGDGAEVTVTGIVTRSKGDFTYFQDATAGLTIRQTEGMFFDQVADGTIAPGVTLTVSGTLSSFRGLQQLNEGGLASYTLGETVGVPAPVAITVQELNDNGEQYEGGLVLVTDLTTDATGVFEERTNYDVTDGTSTGTLRVPNADDSDVDGSSIPEGPFSFTGIVGQFTFDEPAVNGYQLLAINGGDIDEPPAPLALPITFEEDIDYQLADFGNAMSMIVEDPEDATNTVVETFRPMGETCFAGTTVGEVTGFAAPLPFAPDATIMTIRVWSPMAGTPVRFKVEKVDDPTISVETEVTTNVAMEWETLIFDFTNEVMGTSPLDFDAEYTKGSIFFDFWCGGDPPAGMVDATYYWDDVVFGDAVSNEGDGAGLPDALALAPNYPNPFNRSTTVDFALPTPERVVIHVYNVLGQQVATIVNDEMEAGRHSMSFDASALAAGTYFLRLRAGVETLTRSMVVSR